MFPLFVFIASVFFMMMVVLRCDVLCSGVLPINRRFNIFVFVCVCFCGKTSVAKDMLIGRILIFVCVLCLCLSLVCSLFYARSSDCWLFFGLFIAYCLLCLVWCLFTVLLSHGRCATCELLSALLCFMVACLPIDMIVGLLIVFWFVSLLIVFCVCVCPFFPRCFMIACLSIYITVRLLLFGLISFLIWFLCLV